MGGLTDKGFNYNGAWGGTMQMGGSMPGAVGFTYARTKGIPSNGPYAKKTLASAQKGISVSDNTKIKPIVEKSNINRETVRAIPKDERSFLEVLSNFIPGYETYVDARDAVIGGMSGDRARMNQGIIGLGAPFAGKVVTSGIDYLTEKVLGKDVADYNETKRNDVVNMSQNDSQKLFEKYGPGGYDKWVKAGKPKMQNGGEMKFYQEGLDWTPKNISRDGSVTKDNMGYWNPENWGEPVEIDSNQITMQGVYEPLLGISDTGDTQMMYPGEDYEFDGESVTEYPIKKNGGWLEKYK
jgi:hypothetical protein